MRKQAESNANNVELKQLLNDILAYAFPEKSHPLEKLQQFYVEFQRKESKKDGDYQADFKRIRVFNLSRDSKSLILTALHDLSHHIEMTFFGETAHKERFYLYYHNLLITAVGMRIIRKEDLFYIHEKELEKLQKFHGLIRYWEVPEVAYKKGVYYIDVSEGYAYRETLKSWGYRYMALEEIWRGTFEEDTVWLEKGELIELGLSPKQIYVHQAADYQTRFIYYLVIRNAFDHRKALYKLGYRYGAYEFGERHWVKKIPAQKLEEEQEKVAGLMGVKVKVIKQKPVSK